MIPAVLAAIVLVVLLLFGLWLTGRFPFRRYRRKPRRRDFTPLHIQQRRYYKAFLKRLHRGLRFPTLAEKKLHDKQKRQLMKFLRVSA